MTSSTGKHITPYMPRYGVIEHLLSILPGVSASVFKGTISVILGATGTPQVPLDWSDPDAWIPQRMSGAHADLALRIWTESGRTVNPRHLSGSNVFINAHQLLVVNERGQYQSTDRSRAFLEKDPMLLAELDSIECMSELLGILATKAHARRGDLLPEWGEYLRAHTTFKSDSSIKSAMYFRMKNLQARGMVRHEGMVYSITDLGIEHAVSPGESPVPASTTVAVSPSVPTQLIDDPRREVTRAITDFNEAQVRALFTHLSAMPPYQFEHLVRDLLEAMGYDDVTVTRESGDKGVDVVARVQFGITTITEVVQVKRQQGTIGRPLIDQLRGALPYHGAIRGTLITLGKFSSGCAEAALFPGAAPISLIDGPRLLDLLVEHEVGIRRRPALLYEIDADLFSAASEIEMAEAEAELLV